MDQILPITKVRKELTDLVNKANKNLAEYTITVNGSPAAVLMSAAEFQSWKETIAIMGNTKLLKAIQAGEEDINHGRYVTFEQLKKDLKLHV